MSIFSGRAREPSRTSLYARDKAEAIASFQKFTLGQGMPESPIEMFFEISNVCDLKCAMCGEFSALNPLRADGIQSKKRGFIESIELFERFNPLLRRALQVHCFGYGEPTIHPDFRKIVEHISKYEVLIDFFSNGMHFDEDLARFLVDCGLYRVTISFSGITKEAYESVYLGGDFERVLAGIRRIAHFKSLSGSRYPIIEINSLSFKHHVETFEAFVEMMASAGANVIHLKQLQQHPHIPQIQEHISVMRPWIEGKIVNRAIRAGRRLGVHVSADQYLQMGVTTEEQYARRMQQIEAAAQDQLSDRGFGANPISEFASIAQGITPVRRQIAKQPPRALALTEDRAVADALLQVGEPPKHEGAQPFHCMEPFKTMYVTRDGGVKPCCFSMTQTWLLGDAGHSDPAGIWNGIGYETVRESILDGRYPLDLCGHCLGRREAPARHFVDTVAGEYMAWHRERFGRGLVGHLGRLAPDAFNDIGAAQAPIIVERHRRGTSAAPSMQGAADILERLPLAPRLDESLRSILEGNLEAVGQEVVGWVWSPLMPEERLPITVWRQDTLVARGTAGLMRQDLLNAGKGDGAHGFHILLPLEEGELAGDLTICIGGDPNRLRFRLPA